MNALNTLIPPPLIAVLCATFIWFTAKLTGPLSIDPQLAKYSAIFILCLGVLIDVSAVISFRKANTTINPLKPNATRTLVQSGIYRLSRNPMYVGMALFLLAFSVYLRAPLGAAGILVFIAYIQRFQIMPEEKVMEALFGEEYKSYRSSVRRWI